MAERWEYVTIEAHWQQPAAPTPGGLANPFFIWTTSGRPLSEVMADMGGNGWELVQVLDPDGTTPKRELYFKRAIGDD
jgi:hypothetical protein